MTILYCRNQIRVRSARPGDGVRLAPYLRAADRAELAACYPNAPAEQLLERFLYVSRECFVLEYKGLPAALFGVYAPCFFSRRACIWLLTAGAVERMPVAFVRVARAAVAYFLNKYTELYNFTDGRYTAALRFIKRLGAWFDGSSKTCGNVRFLYFVFRRNSWEE